MHALSTIPRYLLVLAIPIATLLAMPTIESAIRQRMSRHWNGRGECPIDDPLGDGLATLYYSLAFAHRIDDWASVLRIHSFVLQRVQERYRLDRAELVDYWSRQRRVPSEEPHADLERTWDLYSEGIAKHGPAFVRMSFGPDAHGYHVTFRNGDMMCVFSFVPKTAPHGLDDL
jgi:hypothetical protein